MNGYRRYTLAFLGPPAGLFANRLLGSVPLELTDNMIHDREFLKKTIADIAHDRGPADAEPALFAGDLTDTQIVAAIAKEHT